MSQGYQPVIVTINLEREAWKNIEKLAKGRREKELYTYSKKRIAELADILVSMAKDEMDGMSDDSQGEEPDEPSERDFE